MSNESGDGRHSLTVPAGFAGPTSQEAGSAPRLSLSRALRRRRVPRAPPSSSRSRPPVEAEEVVAAVDAEGHGLPAVGEAQLREGEGAHRVPLVGVDVE